jgi:hypothetical protein
MASIPDSERGLDPDIEKKIVIHSDGSKVDVHAEGS